MISEATIQKVRDAAQIEEVVGEFVSLKRSGRNYKGLCPFHHEKTPSFTVTPALNIFKCFGCQKGGDAIHFLMEHEKFTYVEAIRYLAKKYNIEIEEDDMSEERREEMQRTESLYILNQFVTEFYQNQLHHTDTGKSVGLSYFKKRGFLKKTIEKFQLGYAPVTGRALLDSLKANGYKEDFAKDLGLINNFGKDFFKDRVIFPIHHYSGKVAAFAGRTMKTGKKIPKYINSPESEIYEKRKTLYGLHQSRNAIRKENVCILVEGYTDVMALHQAGIENVVASSGTALTPDQSRLIKRFADTALVLYDGDAAGIAAATRGLRILLTENLSVEIAALPEGEDPDSFVQEKGKEAMLSFLENEKKDFVIFQLDQILKEGEVDPIARAKGIKSLMTTLAHVEDRVTRDSYLQFCAQKLGAGEDMLHQELQVSLQKIAAEKEREQKAMARRKGLVSDMQGKSLSSEEQEQRSKKIIEDIREREIARLLVQHGAKPLSSDDNHEEDGEAQEDPITVAEHVITELDDLDLGLADETYKQIFDETRDALLRGESLSPQYFTTHKEEAIRTFAIDVLSDPYDYSPNWEKKLEAPLQTQKMPEENHEKDMDQVLLHFKHKVIEYQMNIVKDKLKESIANQNERNTDKYIRMQQKLIEIRKQLDNELRRVVL
ncbi:MAG: DNA primase [Bacteroidetes bacterium]|jgi:DNA primase|nr:DNA primase [Bacteroidota bacterium]